MSNEPDEVNSGALATAIVLVAFATLAVALVVTALVRNTTKEVLVDKDQTQERAFRHMKSEQLSSLTATPAYTDRATGLVSVPIDRAMEIVLADVRANPYAMSPGFKPKKECAEGEICAACEEGEDCPADICDAGKKCAPEPSCEGEDCPEAGAAEADAPAAPSPETPPTPAPGAAAPKAATPKAATPKALEPVAPQPSAPQTPKAPAPVAP